jgi:hypothetical protein
VGLLPLRLTQLVIAVCCNLLARIGGQFQSEALL